MKLTKRQIGALALSWHIARTGDHNADGKADLLLHNDNGLLRLLTMNGAQVIGNALVGNTGTQWYLPQPNYELV